MHKSLHNIIILFIAISITACSGSKSYYKKGKKLDESGLSLEAANFYIESLNRKRSNADAIIALKTTGQKVLDDKLATFYKNYSAERFHDAVYNYLDAQDFKSKVMQVGVSLNEAPYYADYYQKVKNIYIAELYDDAQEFLDQEQFDEAEELLNEVKMLDPKYKNVNTLHNFAFVEPKYRQALHNYDGQHYRKAYFLFKEINKYVPDGYKESKDYQQLALESAQFTIGILPFENATQVTSVESGISASTISAIHNLDDPFLKLVDRSQSDKILEEQLYNMSELVNQEYAQETGNALGTNAILVGKVITANKTDGKKRRERKNGWLGKEVKYVDITTGATKKKIVYSKVYYYEYEQERQINCTFQFQLISASTGEILASDIIEVTKRDHINYATFDGDARLLVPGFWKYLNKKDPSDKIYNSYSYKKAIDQKLKARRNLRSMSDLAGDLYEEVGEAVARQVGTYNPEL